VDVAPAVASHLCGCVVQDLGRAFEACTTGSMGLHKGFAAGFPTRVRVLYPATAPSMQARQLVDAQQHRCAMDCAGLKH